MTIVVVLAALLATSACTRSPEPIRVSRDLLGTVVTISAYGEPSAAVERAVGNAFDTMSTSEDVFSAYPDDAADPQRANVPTAQEVTSIREFNRDPYQLHVLPDEVVVVLGRVRELGVEDFFSPSLLRVVALYDFEGGGTVPERSDLDRLVRAAHAFDTTAVPGGVAGRFKKTETLLAPPNPPSSSFAPPAVGLDLSGAAKGAALDAALRVLQAAAERGEIDGALVSAGSTTLVAGHKTGDAAAEPWRVGIEDPREPDRVIGVVEYSPKAANEESGVPLAFTTVSTSGDYQQFFERGGVRYHHVLDPATGMPARGVRSLTVVGAPAGLDSDILSTALFVMGVERAEEYAREHRLGLFIVDEEGRTRIVPGPTDAAYTIRLSDE